MKRLQPASSFPFTGACKQQCLYLLESISPIPVSILPECVVPDLPNKEPTSLEGICYKLQMSLPNSIHHMKSSAELGLRRGWISVSVTEFPRDSNEAP